MAVVKLAEALLRRKELEAKVSQLKTISEREWTVLRTKRVKVTDGIDEVTASVPRASVAELTSEYDDYARKLRIIDAKIQQTNWTAEVELEDSVMANSKPKEAVE